MRNINRPEASHSGGPMGITKLSTGSMLNNIASDEIKDRVLNMVYDMNYMERLNGFLLLAARHKKTGNGVFVVNGRFREEHYRQALEEAKAAQIRTNRMYVYGHESSCTAKTLCFVKFEEIGLEAT